jgi:hypothetical protein
LSKSFPSGKARIYIGNKLYLDGDLLELRESQVYNAAPESLGSLIDTNERVVTLKLLKTVPTRKKRKRK